VVETLAGTVAVTVVLGVREMSVVVPLVEQAAVDGDGDPPERLIVGDPFVEVQSIGSVTVAAGNWAPTSSQAVLLLIVAGKLVGELTPEVDHMNPSPPKPLHPRQLKPEPTEVMGAWPEASPKRNAPLPNEIDVFAVRAVPVPAL